jgi:hypothetical protein
MLAPLFLVAPRAEAQSQAPCQTYAETGKQVCGKFLDYWRSHGALPIQGFPISNELSEVSETDGKSYTVQYFERAVFEAHPENKPPFDVLLSLAGANFYKMKYPNGAPGQVANKSTGAISFPETGAMLGGQFLAYWQATGGLMQHGFPISQEFTERSELDGKEYKVQYFQRAVFEFHPEKAREFQVLLSQLGAYQFKRKYQNDDAQPGVTRPLAAGTWGGRSISLIAGADENRFELDCAHGVVKGQIQLDSTGKFTHQGTFTFERGGPVREGELEDTHPAIYTGNVSGEKMEVTITAKKPDGDVVLGPFIAEYNKPPLLFKCQ